MCPAVICITESWLCADISDDDIYVPDYVIFRRDRNRHGGGVVVYVFNTLYGQVVYSDDILELLC